MQMPRLWGRPVGRFAALCAVFATPLVWVAAADSTQPYESYEATVAADGPVAQYRFDDAAGSGAVADSAGTLTATNTGITLGGEGPFAGSRSGAFGGEAYATFPSSPLAGASEFTVEAWVDWGGGTSYKQPIFDFGSSSSSYMYLTPASGLPNHVMLLEIHPSSGSPAQVKTTKLQANAWHYVAVTETSTGTLTLYVDGQLAGEPVTATVSPASIGSMSTSYLGKSLVTGDPSFKGSLSNVGFYSKALSANSILAHYNAAEQPVNTVAPTVTPSTPKEGSILTAKPGTWTGLLPIEFKYEWESCEGSSCHGVEATKSTYEVTSTNVGSSLRVTVTAVNSAKEAKASSAQTAKIEPAAPSNTVAPVITGEAKNNQKLTVSTGTWKGTPPLSYAYEWHECNSAGTGCKKIAEARESSLRVPNSAVNGTVKAIVTASNAAGSKSATVITAVIESGPPVFYAAPVITGTPAVGETLHSSTGGWYMGLAPWSITYQWQRCNASGCSPIEGATSNEYKLTSADAGEAIRVTVTAGDQGGTAPPATSEATIPVAGIAPENTASPTISGEAVEGKVLQASGGTWTGTPSPQLTYQWESCTVGGCVPIFGATEPTYSLTAIDDGTRLQVTVTATNIAGTARVTSAQTEEVFATPTELPKIFGKAQTGQVLTVSNGRWFEIPTSFAYQWQHNVDGKWFPISGATEANYVLQTAEVGDEPKIGQTLRAIVTAKNGTGQQAAASAETEPITAGPRGGAAVAWGENTYGGLGQFYKDTQEERPLGVDGLTNITAVSAGGGNLAMLSNGEVDAWGINAHGQLGDNSSLSNSRLGKSHVTVALAAATEVSAGDEHAIALVGRGPNSTVDAWGNNEMAAQGEGKGGFNSAFTPKPVNGLTETNPEGIKEGVKSVAIGGFSDYAVLENGTVKAWGGNTVGQLHTENWPSQCEGNGAKKICEEANKSEDLCVTETGANLCVKKPTFVVDKEGKRLEHVDRVVAGTEAAYALTDNGEVLSWGNDLSGQLGQTAVTPGNHSSWSPPNPVMIKGPSKPEPLTGVVEITAGTNHVLARLKTGQIVGWGMNEKGALGAEPANPEVCGEHSEVPCTCREKQGATCFPIAQPLNLETENPEEKLPSVVALAAGGQYSVAVVEGHEGHEVYAWGRNADGELATGSWEGPEACLTQKQEAEFKKEEEEAIAKGEATKLKEVQKARKLEGACSRKARLVHERGTEPEPGKTEPGPPLKGVTEVSATGHHVVALLEPGVQAPKPLIEQKATNEAAIALNSSVDLQKLNYKIYEFPGTEEAEEEAAESGCTEECSEALEGDEGGSGPPVNAAPGKIRHPLSKCQIETRKEERKGKCEETKVRIERKELKDEFYEHQVVEAAEGKWSGTGPLEYTITWERCPLLGGPCTELSKAGPCPEGKPGEPAACNKFTIPAVTGTGYERYFSLQVTVTAEHGGAAKSVVSPPTGLVKREREPRFFKLDAVKLSEKPGPITLSNIAVGTGAFELNKKGEETAKELTETLPLAEHVGYELRFDLGEKELKTVITPPT
jgi:alpha-tubulin suppressor-like RCC1 family protein